MSTIAGAAPAPNPQDTPATRTAGPDKPRPPRRQWGSERSAEPLSIVHERPSNAKVTLGRIAILVTIGAWAMYVITTIIREFIENTSPSFRFSIEAVLYVVVVTALTFSALMHLIARQGALYRFRDHNRLPRAELDRHFGDDYGHAITVIVPSYVEERSVVSKTLWSAALQEFADIEVVLLIDDPPDPGDPERLADLTATRALPGEIERTLAVPAGRIHLAAERSLAVIEERGHVTVDDVENLAEEYRYAAGWLEDFAARWPMEDHLDEFFVDRVLLGLAGELRLNLLALEAALAQGDQPDAHRIRELHRRLEWIFSARVRSFERKRYASLSHEANKAMNLNAYIGLMGHRWRIEHSADGDLLIEAGEDERADLSIRDTEYLLTLDADSMLLRDYCLRLVQFLEEEGNERVAVTQTPYSSYRGAPTRIERIAGATTDVQHILHQGTSYYNATFWVGANAVIRKRAIEDIVQAENVGGFVVKTYIQDRTVIEDTESSIDLGVHGWTLVNYPERLSYSATPPDFGSLVVQRRRWANGGLLILPKLQHQLAERRRRQDRILLREVMLRVNYMASITWASFGLIMLLAYPFDGRLLSPWVALAAIPYFLALGTDLRDSGHRFSDIFRIYGFNLVLLAVNVAGVLKSLQQAATGEKIPFARTPKVSNRTAAPGLFVFFPYLIIGFSLYSLYRDVMDENWGNAAFAGINAVLCTWAVVAYVGIRNSIVDMVLGVVGWLWVEKKETPQPRAVDPDKPVDWNAILYFGERRLGREHFRRKKERRRRIAARR